VMEGRKRRVQRQCSKLQNLSATSFSTYTSWMQGRTLPHRACSQVSLSVGGERVNEPSCICAQHFRTSLPTASCSRLSKQPRTHRTSSSSRHHFLPFMP
jgi:hypothetical protein